MSETQIKDQLPDPLQQPNDKVPFNTQLSPLPYKRGLEANENISQIHPVIKHAGYSETDNGSQKKNCSTDNGNPKANNTA